MYELEIKHFKAYKDEFTLKLEDKNLLLYGENGAGKSSIYDAFRYVFFKDEIERRERDLSTIGDAEEDAIFWQQYNYQGQEEPFEVSLKDSSNDLIDKSAYQVFMLSIDNLRVSDSIQLEALLQQCFVEIADIQHFCDTHYAAIEENQGKRI